MSWIQKIKEIGRLSRIQMEFLFVLLTYFLVVVLFFYADAADLHKVWTTPQDLEYGYFILAFASMVMVRNSKFIEQTQPFYWSLLALACIACVYWLGSFLEIRTFRHLCIILGFPFVALAVLGREFWAVTWVPCCLVIVVLPAGYLVLPYLQQLTIDVVTFLIRLTSMTAYIEGAYINVPEGVIWIKEGCSGQKYLITAATLALMVIAYDRKSLFKSLPILGLALCLSIVANWVRVFILVLVGYYSGLDHPLMADHDNLGWVVFLIMMTPFFYLSSKGVKRASDGESPPTTSESVLVLQNLSVKAVSARLLALVCALTVLLLPQASEQYWLDNANRSRTVIRLDMPLKSWERFVRHDRFWYPGYSGATKQHNASYSLDGREIDLSVLLYSTQAQGEELDNSQNAVFDKKQWRIKSKHSVELKDSLGVTIPASVTYAVRANSFGAQWVSIYWHNVNGNNVRPGLKSKLYSLTKIWDYKSDDMLVAIGADCRSSCALTEELLTEFVRDEH
ncbi:MAG: EpsI family protein, partial [Gammaproteobacteria bacterium]